MCAQACQDLLHAIIATTCFGSVCFTSVAVLTSFNLNPKPLGFTLLFSHTYTPTIGISSVFALFYLSRQRKGTILNLYPQSSHEVVSAASQSPFQAFRLFLLAKALRTIPFEACGLVCVYVYICVYVFIRGPQNHLLVLP